MRNELSGFVADDELARLVVADAHSRVTFGGGTLHHLDAKRGIIEIGYWLYPRARGRGIATKVARALAEYAFTLGVQRVTAYVRVGNLQSERVLERAGFTREGVLRSMPKGGGGESTRPSSRCSPASSRKDGDEAALMWAAGRGP